MRARFTPPLRFAGFSLLCAGLVAASVAESANAGPATKGKREPQHASNVQLLQGLHALQATKRTLESADHDYGGHRVNAVKAITAAEHQLKLALATEHKRPAGAGAVGTPARRAGKGGKRPEAQNVSNLQLAEGIRIIERTRATLEKGDRDYGGHLVAAIRDLGVAEQQLKLALKFEKRK